MANFTYLIIDNEEKEIAVIDPSWDLEKIFDFLSYTAGFEGIAVFLSHGNFIA